MRARQELWRACVRGSEPAEVLTSEERHRLVVELAGRGWSDLEIALHTRMTEYTTARIRTRAVAS